MMYKNNEKGFSIVEVVIAAGILGALALGAIKLLGNVSGVKDASDGAADESRLSSVVGLLLTDSKHCRVSLAGNGPAGNPATPVTFKKEDIDEDTEGLDIEFFLSNQSGSARESLKFSPSDPNGSKFGNLQITGIKLRMDNGNGYNYMTEANHKDVGHIIFEYQKKINGTSRDLVLKFPVSVTLKTDASQETTILGCQLTGSGGSLGGFEGAEVAVFNIDNTTPSVTIDMSLYTEAKFLQIEGICRCSSTSGNMFINAFVEHSDGTAKSYSLCSSSQAGVRFPSSLMLPISSLYREIILNFSSTCGGFSNATGILLQ